MSSITVKIVSLCLAVALFAPVAVAHLQAAAQIVA
jgi:hypothetical protein